MSNIFDKELVLDTLFVNLGLPDKALILSKEKKRLYNLLTFEARKKHITEVDK